MDTNYKIWQTHKQIADILNNCELSVGTAYFLLKDIFLELENLYKNSIVLEKNEETTQQTLSLDFQDVLDSLASSEVGEEGDNT